MGSLGGPVQKTNFNIQKKKWKTIHCSIPGGKFSGLWNIHLYNWCISNPTQIKMRKVDTIFVLTFKITFGKKTNGKKFKKCIYLWEVANRLNEQHYIHVFYKYFNLINSIDHSGRINFLLKQYNKRSAHFTLIIIMIFDI